MMKLTPLDIRHKEFTRAMRGYKDLEVDEFLDQIVEEFERLFNENIDYKDRLENLESKMEQYQNIEETLKKTLVSAQQQADELKQNAQKEADLILRDAELKSRGIINDSYAERQKVQRSVQALKQKYEDLRYEIRKVIESFVNIIDQDQAAARLEELDEVIEAAPEAAAEPAVEAATPDSVPESLEARESARETDFPGDAGYAREEEGMEDAVRIPQVEVIEDKTIIADDPFADLDTDTDDQKFKW
ncbi:MAG: DivIVA domain-containing protein [Gaiellales bacterium]|nr:MAG: DivIVA domain-containing protein [Gaiellales bacterium]